MRKLTFVLLPVLIACTGPQKKESFNSTAVELNDLAIQLYHEGNGDSALVVFDKAIALDETYYIPHSGKIAVYLDRNELARALYDCEMIIKKKPDLPQYWTLAGVLHEWHGNKGTALNYYSNALRIYDQKLSKTIKVNTNEIFEDRLNRAMALILIGNEDVGREEMRTLKTDFPDNALIDELLITRREDFITQIFRDESRF